MAIVFCVGGALACYEYYHKPVGEALEECGFPFWCYVAGMFELTLL